MPPTRPATISELATAAKADPDAVQPSSQPLKYYLKKAEGNKERGRQLVNAANDASGSGAALNRNARNINAEAVGVDLERAFIELVKAATLVVTTIPGHRDYSTELNPEQRGNLEQNGQDLLDQIGRLKTMLVERYDRYARSPAASADAVPAFTVYPESNSVNRSGNAQRAPSQRRATEQVHSQAQRVVADEAGRWRAQREEAGRRDVEYDAMYASPQPQPQLQQNTGYSTASAYASGSSSRPPAAQQQPTYLSSASAAAARQQQQQQQQGQPPGMPVPVSMAATGGHVLSSASAAPAALPPSFGRGSVASSSASAYSGGGGGGGGGSAYPSSAGVSFPQPYNTQPSASPVSTYSRSSSTSSVSAAPFPSTPFASSSPQYRQPQPQQQQPPPQGTPILTPGPMPLRAIHEYDGESTDSEGPSGWRTGAATRSTYPDPPAAAPPRMSFPTPSRSSGDDLSAGMARLSTSSLSGDGSNTRIDGLPPSSSSFSPSAASIAYPSLARHMSLHQRTQGYVPGAWGSSLPPAVPAVPGGSAVGPQDANSFGAPGQRGGGGFAGVGATGWGAQQQQAIESARVAAQSSGAPAGYATSFAPAPPKPSSHAHASMPPPQPQPQSRPPPPSSSSSTATAAPPPRRADTMITEDSERRELDRNGRPRLRTVVFPQATLSRFLSIASANTARNLETCGLLLGREVVRGAGDASGGGSGKARYVVETLLIPKQHATSDTCTMDEEETVLMFTEARGLITLGWIHTHPSQSCFMSSVDLHTHASFQRMLPESFAVVCAPKSDPTFGIFRLTDPPGLQTVLDCREKQAFHPHPDVPIYTDADKGHVQMRDAPLEIVDLR